ncbi:hypothetical protein MPTK1_6g20950 [Marchantia polymorpha subsp. ruderalis]|uniref:Uncharacterized protein n=2 Tax=Marchantia polymorpha TaxID=3197 RepID=A0AAF6BUC2_MARPO|nr:hypothetical protein MARPO_0091s0060 [Marchantia polymorpha]BBN15606.1 hypothetical protein Mp_6g20950 [Marchantia polymorpha subsp. ruderalis]|eukprot:PTQ33211.1 hypothetical protein MARPO_0091s0060 [Marchantia polymorpha]
MARVCIMQIVPSSVPLGTENAAVSGGMGCVSRVLLSPYAGFQIPAIRRNTAFLPKTGVSLRTSLSLQGRTSEKCRHPMITALSDDSAGKNGSANCGNGKAAFETLDVIHEEDARPAVDDRTSVDSSAGQPSMSFAGDQRDVRGVFPSIVPSVSNNTQNLTGNENSSKGPTSGSVTLFSGHDKSVFLNSSDYDPTKTRRASPVENGGSVDGDERNERYFKESEKPSFVSLVWEAGAKIEGVTTDVRQEENEPNEQSLSLIIDEDYRARKDETIFHCFWIWSRDSASNIWAWAQTVIRSTVFILGRHNQRWKAFWKQALLGAQVPRRFSEAKEVWSSIGDATQRTLWLPREDDAFDIFFRNMIEIQKNILQMTAVQGKLAWIRLQQQYYRKLMALEEILATFPNSEDELNSREVELLAYTEKLLTQAKMNQEAYASSQEALSTAEEMVFHLQTQVDELKEDVVSRDNLLRLLQKEGTLSSQSLQRAAQSLQDAEKKMVELERRVHVGEDLLYKERDKLTAALRTAGLHEHALKIAELKVAELTAEVTSLKESLGTGKGVEQLTAQVKTLEQELRSRDRLLLEIKEETLRSTEALKLAAQIKQDLNATRQREIHLTQTLEAANEKIKELEGQLAHNVRATRAEGILKQSQKMLSEVKSEVELLRQGVEARDRAINIMKDEVDTNIDLLRSAARNREELRNMNRHVGELRMELESRDAKLSMMREEMALIIDLAKKQQSPRKSRSKTIAQSPATSTSSSSPVDVEELKPKRKTPVRKSRESGTSSSPARKPNGTRRTTRSPPQLP